jgi:YD repeat-containing protein
MSTGPEQYGRPTNRFFFDAWGRQVGRQDANSNVSTAQYDALGRRTTEFQADGGMTTNTYDLFDRKTYSIDPIGRHYSYGYDRANRLVSESAYGLTHAWAGGDPRSNWSLYGSWFSLGTYQFDEIGNLVQEVSGADEDVAGQARRYLHDARGNVVTTRLPKGEQTHYWFDAAGNQVQELDPIGGVKRWQYDQFKRLNWSHDLSGVYTNYHYNAFSKELVQKTSQRGQNISYSYFQDGQLRSISDAARNSLTTYGLDLDGNRKTESMVMAGITYRNVAIDYDALGRMTRVVDTTRGTAADPLYEVEFRYDLNSNKRAVVGSYLHDDWVQFTPGMGPGGYYDGNPDGMRRMPINYWFTYDAMNRMLIDSGSVDPATGVVSANLQGRTYAYDAAGNRTQEWIRMTGPNGETQRRLTHTYDFANRILKTDVSTHYSNGGVSTRAHRRTYYAGTVNAAGEAWRVDFYEARGSVTDSLAYADAAPDRVETTETYFDANGRTVRLEGKVIGVAPGTAWYWNYRQSMTVDFAGRVTSTSTEGYSPNANSWNVGGFTHTTHTSSTQRSYAYAGYDSYKEASITATGSVNYGSGWQASTPQTTTQSYDVNTQLSGVSGVDPRSVVTDDAGRVVRVSRGDGWSYSHVDSVLFANDQLIGQYQSVYRMTYSGNPWEPDTTTRQSYFGNFEALGGASRAASTVAEGSGTRYVARSGDTFRSLAQAFYGDGNLWFVIAQANGFDPTQSLTPGLELRIPQVTRSSNTSDTFAVYEPARVVGDVTPDPIAPPPPSPQGKGCGAIGTLLMVVVAVAVTYVTAGAATAALGGQFWGAVGGGAIGAAAGSAASQAVGVAIGAQDKFSWRQVGLAAIGGAVGGAIYGVNYGGAQYGGGFGSKVIQSITGGRELATVALQAATHSVITQGIGSLTGAQSFNWRAVAVSAVAAPITASVSKALRDVLPKNVLSTGVIGTVNAALTQGLRMAVYNKGKLDWAHLAADAFGNAIGNNVVDRIQNGDEFERAIKQSDAMHATAKRGEPFKTGMDGNVVPLRGLSFQERNALISKQMSGEPLTTDESDRLYAHNSVMRRTLEGNGATLGNGYQLDAFGNVRYFTLDHNNAINVLPDESIVERRFYSQSGRVTYLADGEALPAGIDASNTGVARELRFADQLIARDFGVPHAYRNQIGEGSFFGGDAVDAIRRQVALDAQRYPALAKFIDPGSGQVNPLEWDGFLAAARGLDSLESPISMVVASNGLMNTYQTARNNAAALAGGLRDAIVVNVLNPSTGRMFVDGVEALKAEATMQRQSVQGAIQAQMLEAIGFNGYVSDRLGLNTPQQTMFIGHSQGTINGNLAIMGLQDPDLLRQVRLINVGTATRHLPQGLGGFVNIYDANDPVPTRLTGGSQMLDHNFSGARGDADYLWPALNVPANYSEIRTNFAADGMLTGNSHSLYLYLMRQNVQQALGFKQHPSLAMPYTDYGR